MRKPLVLAALTLAVVLGGGLLGGGWYYADQLEDGALTVKHDPPTYDLEVAALEAGQITLRTLPSAKKDGNWTKPGLWGLAWDGGHGQVGAILSISDQQVVRGFYALQDSLALGEKVRLGSFGFPVATERVAALQPQEVSYRSPLGAFPAWFTPGPRPTWAVLVHGKGDLDLKDLRLAPLLAELGYPTLRITYRNDEGVPPNPDGYYRYGQAEWEDLEGAVRYAQEQGAQDVVLVGYSMGGAIVLSFLYRSSLADKVRGVVLDAPVLDFSDTVDLGASQRHIPGPLKLPVPSPMVAIAKALTSLRFDVDWQALDYLARASDLKTPMLLFHGDADLTTPVENSDALARARPDLVTYLRVPKATHVRAWNVGPEAYEKAVRDFLGRVVK